MAPKRRSISAVYKRPGGMGENHRVRSPLPITTTTTINQLVQLESHSPPLDSSFDLVKTKPRVEELQVVGERGSTTTENHREFKL